MSERIQIVERSLSYIAQSLTSAGGDFAEIGISDLPQLGTAYHTANNKTPQDKRPAVLQHSVIQQSRLCLY